MLTRLQYRLLKRISPGEPAACSGAAYHNKSKVAVLLGAKLLDEIRGKTVIDFGCGEGTEAIEFAQFGAAKVIGLDIRESTLRLALEKAARSGVADRCVFTTATTEKADVIISIDAFEHYDDPAAVLRAMHGLMAEHGAAWVSFGSPWYHPYGGHLFSVFPWAHLIFSEKALIRWRQDLRSDGATRFHEVEGGLNQMTIGWFESLIAASPLRADWIELVPIRKLARLHNRLTREFTTSVIRCRLVRRDRP